jgi:isopenicillin N synthase-like dioxygenase
MDAIPTLDFTAFRSGDAAARRQAAAELGAAFERYGFVQLIGHGLPEEVLRDGFAAAESFFLLPQDWKREVQDPRTNRGYVPMFDKALRGLKPGGHEAFSVGQLDLPEDPALRALPFHAETPWPDVAGFRERVEACYAALYALGDLVLSACALHLGAPEDVFRAASRDHFSTMRLIHYPPAGMIEGRTDIGMLAHVDESLITLLAQDMNGGLSVQGPGGDWLPVVPDRNAVVVNVGRLLRRWTNGRYNAALHEVVNRTGGKRHSIALFVHPAWHARIDPRSLVGEAPAGPEFEPVIAGEEVYSRIAARPAPSPAGAAAAE